MSEEKTSPGENNDSILFHFLASVLKRRRQQGVNALHRYSSSSPFPSMHEVKPFSDLLEGQSVRHKLVHLDLLVHVLLHQFGDAVHALVALEKCKRVGDQYVLDHVAVLKTLLCWAPS